ncbi:hypothetical protein L7F22_021172 [Adiantum nelumboides]|nr:hypothetical protein [Adiantum nelumboides]
MEARGEVRQLADVFAEGEFEKASLRLRSAVESCSHTLRTLDNFLHDNQQLSKLVQGLPSKVSYPIMVPFGKAAFFPGKLVHTNELLVLLGEGYYVECSAFKSLEILGRRCKLLGSQIMGAKSQLADLNAEFRFFNETFAEAAGHRVWLVVRSVYSSIGGIFYQQRRRTMLEHTNGEGNKELHQEGLVLDILGSGKANANSELCRAWGQARDHQSLVFFDPGARANFITPQLAEKMGIKTDETGPAYTASIIALGHEVAVTPLIRKLRLHIQGYVGHKESFIMPLEGCELGMPWFYNHKAVLDSFNKKITLDNRGRKIVLDVKLKGESVPLVSASAVPRLMKQHIIVYMIYVKEKDETKSSNLSSSLDVSRCAFLDNHAFLLDQCSSDFQSHDGQNFSASSSLRRDFFDDMIVFSKLDAEHMEHLRAVFEMLRKERLVVNTTKIEFFMEMIRLGTLFQKTELGWILQRLGRSKTGPNQSIFMRFAVFLGCAHTIADSFVSLLAAPLHDLTCKGVVFRFGERQQQAFKLLKEKLTTEPVLILPDLKKSFQVQCDACGNSIGAVLMQDGHVIAYESRAGCVEIREDFLESTSSDSVGTVEPEPSDYVSANFNSHVDGRLAVSKELVLSDDDKEHELLMARLDELAAAEAATEMDLKYRKTKSTDFEGTSAGFQLSEQEKSDSLTDIGFKTSERKPNLDYFTVDKHSQRVVENDHYRAAEMAPMCGAIEGQPNLWSPGDLMKFEEWRKCNFGKGNSNQITEMKRKLSSTGHEVQEPVNTYKSLDHVAPVSTEGQGGTKSSIGHKVFTGSVIERAGPTPSTEISQASRHSQKRPVSKFKTRQANK